MPTAQAKAPATRLTAFGLLVVAAAIVGGNALMLRVIGRYFPILLAFVGPLVSMGFVGLASPRFLDALFSSVDKGHPAWAVTGSMVAFIVGVALSLYLLFRAYYG
jgi:hypothetical protein